jgi:hypothetical protein
MYNDSSNGEGQWPRYTIFDGCGDLRAPQNVYHIIKTLQATVQSICLLFMAKSRSVVGVDESGLFTVILRMKRKSIFNLC